MLACVYTTVVMWYQVYTTMYDKNYLFLEFVRCSPATVTGLF